MKQRITMSTTKKQPPKKISASFQQALINFFIGVTLILIFIKVVFL